MDCYKDFSLSRDALSAIGNIIFLSFFLGAAIIKDLASVMMPVRSLSGFPPYQRLTPTQ
jgi:hypothetical protein